MVVRVVNVCLYFQVHQPYRMKKYRFLDIGKHNDYFDDATNKEICERVAKKCYLPANDLMLKLINENNGKFKVSYSITGIALEQFEKYAPEVIDSFKKLADTGCVEFLAETYYHSLAFLFSEKEFDFQVKKHSDKIKELFGVEPKIFRNTELIYDNKLASFAEALGYKGILSEGPDQILGWRSPNFLYKPKGSKSISLMMKNFKLSDDIAFRFSDKSWDQWPLTTEKFASWVASIDDGHSVNLFMDYETLGEHHWEDTGIFGFFEDLPKKLEAKGIGFMTPSEVVEAFDAKQELDIDTHVSWADKERDISAWLSNKMQKDASSELYKMEQLIKSSGDEELLRNWRLLTTSDHLYYMSTKTMNDGAVHNYFSPYKTPYDSFISYMNIISDMSKRLSLGDNASISENFDGSTNNINHEILNPQQQDNN